MLEIKSDWQEIKSSNGSELIFTVYMKRDKEWFNCAVVPNMINDPEDALETLKAVIHTLTTSCYPEILDPVYRCKKRLKVLELEKNVLEQQIKDFEEIREKGFNPYKEENFCEHEGCRVRFLEHYHIDKHILTFSKPDEK